MSGKGGGGGGGGGGNNGLRKGNNNTGLSGIPPGSRKMVQSLKEIVNCPEPEIYAMLKECNMDPNEAFNRLLSQVLVMRRVTAGFLGSVFSLECKDKIYLIARVLGWLGDPFNEVKSKREKKKESKDTVDPRPRGVNNPGSRGGRSGSDRYIGGGGSSHYYSNESGPSHGKPSQKRENGTHAVAASSSYASSMQGNSKNHRPTSHSEVVVSEHKMSTVGLGDVISSASQPTGYQSAWVRVPGQVSMADIVKMGIPQNKASALPNSSQQSTNNRQHAVPPSAALHSNLQEHVSKVSDITYEPDVNKNQHVSPRDEWPPIENPSAASVTSVIEAPSESGLYANASNLPWGRTNQHLKSQLEEAHAVDDGPLETINSDHVRSPSISSRNIQEDNSRGSSLYDNDSYKDMDSYQPQGHAFENDDAEDGSSSNSKAAIKKWSGKKNQFPGVAISDLEKKIQKLEEDAQQLNNSSVQGIAKELSVCRAELWRLHRIEEQIWLQNSRKKWLNDGDRNTRFFHTCASVRRKRNALNALIVDGNTTHDPIVIKAKVKDHFFKIYNDRSTLEVEDIGLVFPRISFEQNMLLEKEFSEEEVWETLKSCDSNKAPGPDGLNLGFFKRFWSVLKGNIMQFFHRFFVGKEWEHGINHTFITLIPKESNIGSLDDYRPISLVGGVYKILSKCLSRRLRSCIEDLISPTQFAFIPGRQILDCSLIANEGIDYWRKKGLKGCVFKVDFKKAYDTVDWPILFKVMEKMGFGFTWISWIRRCVSTASISVLVNGVPSEEFPMAKGLRQGCSLSPLLFNLVGELLNLLIRRAVSEGLFAGLTVGKEEGSFNLSHLQFADDLIIFCGASKTQIMNVKRVLRVFEVMSGLQLNLKKSRLFGINISQQEVKTWADSIGCLVGNFPSNYLGLPLGATRNSSVIWEPVVQNFHSKLAGWKAATLSLAGRLVLIKSVLSSLPTYFLSIFKIPASILKTLNSIMSNFLWGGGNGIKKIHWVKWDDVCKSKTEGGLGVRNLIFMNRALLGKWSWRFANERNYVWRNFICSKYNIDSSRLLFDSKIPSQSSWLWRSVVNNHFKQDSFGCKFRSLFKFYVGNGKHVRFWQDSWAADFPLQILFSRLFSLSTNKFGKLCEFGEFISSGWIWDVKVRRNLNDWELEQWCNLVSIISSFSISIDSSDGLIWKGSGDGVYTVGSCIKSCASISEETHFWNKIVWRGLVPPRVETLVWQIVLQKIAVKSELVKRGVQGIEDGLCPLCKMVEESSSHLFFSCSVAWSLWNKFLNFWRFSSVFSAEAKNFLLAWDELKSNSVIWTFIPGAVIWTIWKFRNYIVFEGGKLDQTELFFLTRVRLASWYLAKNKDVSIPKDSLISDPSIGDSYSSYNFLKSSITPWLPPPTGFIKLNVDAAISCDWEKSGLGGLMRDHSGAILGSFQEPDGSGPPTLKELKAIQRGISFFTSVLGRVQDRLIIESDSRVAVDWINKVVPCPAVYGFIVRDIVECLKTVGGVVRWIARTANVDADALAKAGIDNDDREPPTEEDNPSVIIPNHLQVHTQNCSHLSFGSFGPGIGSAFSGPFASMASKNNLDKVPEAADASSMTIGHSDNRDTEYYGDDHLRSNSEGNIINRSNTSTGNYEVPEDSRPEILKQDASEAAQGSQYAFPPSAPGYNYENPEQLNPAFTHMQTSAQMQNLNPFSSVMQGHTNSLPSTLLTSTFQSAREPDLPYSPFPVTQSMPMKYSNAASSISGPTITTTEALRAARISAPQPTLQSLPGAKVATGPALQQHLAMHPFSQPTLPLGHFANMIGYPFLPQSYTYMPSAFQQTFAGNSNYPQSLAAMLPQFKNSVSVSSLPQPAAVPPGYGFGSSTNIPGVHSLNPPTAPAGTIIGYDDVLSSQYKDNNHLMSLQQNENSAMWIHGPGSRTLSAVPASTYYSIQGQNQQADGFRQGQQPPSQHFGSLGYPSFYQSQTGVSLDHQQNSRNGSLSGSQGQPPSKQTQQLWPNNY
ncbi:kinase-related family protein [Hibiscus syriacus]|uniref:Kinase-related family protein n=1 Tax=Hibiscus syriacus TaxID=106335 RepID=A0A6A2XXQ6_HIBSY|nr:kinase-related family protein [Hibiscus syriacus]